MLIEQFLREVTALPGLTGNEQEVARYIADAFAPLADEVRVDSMQSVIARIKGDGPKVMFAAHLDEIGLMVTNIEKDGALRLGNVGGVDPRILPGMMVKVLGKQALTGVIGAKAIHLLSAQERKSNYKREDLYVDLGLPYEQVVDNVQIGDLVQLEQRFVNLKNNRIATKTADDRACVAIMYRAMQLLKGMRPTADLYFVATCQEEIGGHGALTASYGIAPDYAIALDVCHAQTPDAPRISTQELTSPALGMGPYLHPVLRQKIVDIADKINVTVQTDLMRGRTSTDADEIGTACGGVPTALLELPLKYMHTTVETFDMRALEECARLLAQVASEVTASWGDELWT